MRELLLLLVASSIGVGCSDAKEEAPGAEVELTFEARFGDERLGCARALSEVGASGVSAELLDLRIYVHDVQLLREGAEPAALELVADGAWQSGRVALLDFEDGTGRCATGTVETHTTVRGRVAEPGEYTGVSFRVGVPSALNHLDLSTAEPPLDVPGMYWSWQGGYKYVRADLATDQHPNGYLFHLGAAGCAGSPSAGYACADEHVATIDLTGDVRKLITLDLEPLFAGVDLANVPDRVTDLVPGCMSSATDPECAPMLAALGLPRGEQRLFELP